MGSLLDSLGGPVGLIGGVGSILGTINAANEARRLQQQRELAVQQYQTAGLQSLEGNYLQNQRGQYGAAGQGSDAILQGSRNLGASLAAGGVYNPSVVAGAGLQQQQSLDTSLADLAARNAFNQQQGLASLNQNAASMRLGIANTDYGNALSQQGYARQGLSSYLGALSQNNLARSGANTNRMAQPSMNGTIGQAAALPGVNINQYPVGTPLHLPNESYGAPLSSTYDQMPMSSSRGFAPPATPSLLTPRAYRPYSRLAGDVLQGR